MPRKRRGPVPDVLWRFYRGRARTLLDTIISLLPEVCQCSGRRCLACTPDARSFLLRPDDSSDYGQLLTKSFVVVSENAPSIPCFVPHSNQSQDQIVKRSIALMYQRRSASSNVLCLGNKRSNCSRSIVELLSCASWSCLLSRVGDNFMVYLLSNTSVFLPAAYGKHHQVAGPSLSDLCFDKLKRQRSSKFDCQHPSLHKCGAKKRKSADIDDVTVNNVDAIVSEFPKSTRNGTVIRKPESEAKQDLNCITPRVGKRSRPFSWQRRSSKKQKQLTFEENSPNKHCNMLPTITDCMSASFQLENTSSSYHEKMLCQCSGCLMLQSLPAVPRRTNIERQSIFYNLDSSLSVLPRKHILYSLRPNLTCSKYLTGKIFDFSDANANAHSITCFSTSGSCLIDSGCLYHSLVKFFRHLIHRTLFCQHTKLLNKHCAVEAKYSQGEAVKSYCSNSQVVSFIWAVSRNLLTSELLGTPSNCRILRRNISRFIKLRRFEKFPFKLCLHELKISGFPFLSNKYFLNNKSADVKRKLLEKWIFWYFSYLVVPLVETNFYVTESEQGKHDIYYYPKPVWEKLTNSTRASFEDWRYSFLDDVAVRNILGGRSFGFSKLRLQPKGNGVRMVANLKCSSIMPLTTSTMGVRYHKTEEKARRQKIKIERYRSVNSALRDAHSILKGIQFKEPEKLGSSVFDYNDVYKKLCPFLVGHKKGSTSLPSLFIVTSDVLKAFDSVDQDMLLDIMKSVLLKDEYCVKRYYQVVCKKKSLWVQQATTVLDVTSNTGYTRFASLRSQHGVFVSKKQCEDVKRKVLFSNLTEHVKHNVLQFDGKFYLQGVGIPQGGILSSLLCSLYYGDLDRRVMFPFLEKTLESSSCKENSAVHSSSYMLMRFVDDFLFISTSKKQAASFLDRLQRGFCRYNCYMNEKKFGANFDVEEITGSPSNNVYVSEDGATSFLRWSGLLINCKSMEIQADYTRYLNNHLSSTLTVTWQGKPGIRLEEKLRLFLRPKCHPIFFDSNINSAAVVRLNIYQVFLLSAMKFHCYIQNLSFVCKLHKRFCSDIIQRSLRYMFLLIKKMMHSMHLSSGIQPILKLEKEEVEWLGLHAYIQVLKRKQSRHKELLVVLRSRFLSQRKSGSVSPELKYAINPKNSSLLWDIKY